MNPTQEEWLRYSKLSEQEKKDEMSAWAWQRREAKRASTEHTPAEVANVLRNAATLLRYNRWAPHDDYYQTPRHYCLVTALVIACDFGLIVNDAVPFLYKVLGPDCPSAVDWSLAPGRTQDEVIALFEQAAKIAIAA